MADVQASACAEAVLWLSKKSMNLESLLWSRGRALAAMVANWIQ
jgi:hypothetical protein